jgi:plastocyanin
MKISMLRWIGIGFFVSANLGLTAPASPADSKRADNNKGQSVTVAFGSGLNTLPPSGPSGPENHHILPTEIKVRQGGVVHFLVSGFHMAVVYKPGTTADDIVIPATGLFINDPAQTPPANVFYFGIVPQGAPGVNPTTDPLNGSNRQESVSFTDPGTYLVICNVTPHFRDGMFAYVKVVPSNEDLADDHSHH